MQESIWNGFRRVDFSFMDRAAILVFPNEENKTDKWLLKTEYFDAFPDLEIEMVKRGWPLAYVANLTRWCLDEDLDVKKAFAEYVEKGGVVLAVCGGFSMLGKSCVIKDEVTDGLGILDFYTEAKKDRFIGNVIVESNLDGENVKIAGFENHGGLTFIGDLEPFGKVLFGNGNNGEDKKEGVLYNNLIGSYLHGPLLPKNAKLTDFILSRALKQKYGEEVKLTKLDDSLEDKALEFMLKKCNIN